MPSFRKLSPAEIAVLDLTSIGACAEIAWMYDEYLAQFVIGNYGRVAPSEGERRSSVRRRLHSVAHRRGHALRFRSGPGALTFQVAAAPAMTQ